MSFCFTLHSPMIIILNDYFMYYSKAWLLGNTFKWQERLTANWIFRPVEINVNMQTQPLFLIK